MGGLENALVGVNKNVITNLEPIVIYDPNGEYFTDLASALISISQFGFPTPLNSYYNPNSKSLYLWYPSSYLEDMFVGYNSNTELAFGVNNHISIQDPSGFIYGFAGNAFQVNDKTEYSKPNKFKVFYSTEADSLNSTKSDIEIEQCYSNNGKFAKNATGNINIKFGVFNGNSAFIGYSGTNENIIRIGHLDYVGGDTFANDFSGKFVIESINPSLLASCPGDIFNTANPAILHLPFYAKGTVFGNLAEANIKSSVSTNRVVYDGFSRQNLDEITTGTGNNITTNGLYSKNPSGVQKAGFGIDGHIEFINNFESRVSISSDGIPFDSVTFILPAVNTGEHTLLVLENLIQTASNFANDALAGAGGIAVGQLYHTAGVVKIRLT